ncbi:acetyl-CoA hydrolase/transferase family protein [Haloplasma contractile]|uniref:4-hydroxybutyrate CoA transferase protein n=1 Tax=Haloplasma contractile SSD-17B TaxID=1033810 RepID=U2EAF1_9MOLU|nr:acetyl-CoA hydrolase/transferase C-terminal domain-containing protein [Haloplasma contractile]ERJ11811.1 4-hydroxybutyrate CoA transferase protein [Haloplasma contractile SSD-17B]
MFYEDKLITVEQALAMIKSNDVIVTGLGAAEARATLSKLHTIADRVHNVKTTTCLPMNNADYFMNEDYSDTFQMDGWFYTGPLRKAHKNGNISFIPNHLHLAGKKRLDYVKPNIYIGNATPPDQHGYVSLSLSNVYEKRMLEAADLVIIEINPKLPRTFGDLEVHVNDIDFMIKVDYDIPELPDNEPNEKDLEIGSFIANFINDGDCIQLGIGGIPNAVAASLMDKKDLGVHTEMLTTGLMKLAKAGVVTGKRKNHHRGKMVCTFALGTRELYDFLDDNPSVLIEDGNIVNDPYEIGLNDNQVSINTTIEVDLTGQCASESIGSVQFSGTGGQADTAIGAQRAKNGRSFIALYSTANVKNRETGEREEISKIVPHLKPGAAVSLSRNDVDYVVTEYGVASLRGTSVSERVDRLIRIAHPKFREELKEQALKLGLIYE